MKYSLVVIAIGLTHCTGANPNNHTPTRPETMHSETHQLMAELQFHSSNVYDAVIYGELENAKVSAAWLSQYAVGEDVADMEVLLKQNLAREATLLAKAKTFDEVSIHLGRVFSRCGSCHGELGLTIDVKEEFPLLTLKKSP